MSSPRSIVGTISALGLRMVELFRALARPVEQPSRRLLLGWIFGPLLLGLAITCWVWASDFDMRSQFWIFERGGHSWAMGEHPFWRGLYRFGVVPALSVAAGALLLLGLSQSRRKLNAWRLICLFWIFSIALGPV